MRDGPQIVGIAALVGDQARAEVLTALMADRALTATELAAVAGVTKQTISAHLAKLVDAGLVAVTSQGRHRYFRLADRDVAQLIESLMGVAFRTGAVRARSSPREPALRKARVCYDHLAGEVAVGIYESLLKRHAFATGAEGLELTPVGQQLFRKLGVDVDALSKQKRALCKPCLDWSERRYHLAGALGAALFARAVRLGWLKAAKDSRVVSLSMNGKTPLNAMFGVSDAAPGAAPMG
jgi:DNA-binding transcriptional ArsR family regulator